MPKVESMPSFSSSVASTSNLAATEVKSIAEPPTTETTAGKTEKPSLSTAASTSNLSDATSTGLVCFKIYNINFLVV